MGRTAVIRTAQQGDVVVEMADTYWRRLRGMLGRRRLPDALLLVPGNSVHGMGMLAALDVAQLEPASEQGDGAWRVRRTAVLRPMGLVGSRRGVRAVLEAPAGSFERWGLGPGDLVHLAPPA